MVENLKKLQKEIEEIETTINIFELDRHLAEQASLSMFWGERWARALDERDFLACELDLYEAQLDGKIREDAEKTSTKITEAGIKNKILCDKKRIEMNDKKNEASAIVNHIAVARNAIDAKKKSLEGMVSLFIAGYFSEPNLKHVTPANAKSFKDFQAGEAQKDNLKTMRENMKNRKSSK